MPISVTVRSLERAFLAVGPTQIKVTPGPVVEVKLLVHNTGRTGAVITGICGEFSRTPPQGDTPYYSSEVKLTDLSVAAGAETVLDPFPFEDEFVGDQFFWGYLTYRDIFRTVHRARFCVTIVPRVSGPGRYQLAGSERWRECL
jgi:hypothetical protein